MTSLNFRSGFSVLITKKVPVSFFNLNFLFIKILLFLVLFFPTYLASEDERYTACSAFDCGNFKDVTYPFWINKLPNYCGHPKFKLDCEGDNATVEMMSQKFHVIDINPTTSILLIARLDLWGNKCPNQYTNINLDYAFFNYTSNDQNTILLYDCDPLPYSTPVNFSCPIGSVRRQAIYVISTNWGNVGYYPRCKINMTGPVLKVAIQSFVKNAEDVGYVLDQGFEVRWAFQDEAFCEPCKLSGRRCGYNVSTDQFRCFCSDQAFAITCANNPSPSPGLEQFDGVASTYPSSSFKLDSSTE